LPEATSSEQLQPAWSSGRFLLGFFGPIRLRNRNRDEDLRLGKSRQKAGNQQRGIESRISFALVAKGAIGNAADPGHQKIPQTFHRSFLTFACIVPKWTARTRIGPNWPSQKRASLTEKSLALPSTVTCDAQPLDTARLSFASRLFTAFRAEVPPWVLW